MVTTTLLPSVLASELTLVSTPRASAPSVEGYDSSARPLVDHDGGNSRGLSSSPGGACSASNGQGGRGRKQRSAPLRSRCRSLGPGWRSPEPGNLPGTTIVLERSGPYLVRKRADPQRTEAYPPAVTQAHSGRTAWVPCADRPAACRRHGCCQPVTDEALGLCPQHLAEYEIEAAARTLALTGKTARPR